MCTYVVSLIVYLHSSFLGANSCLSLPLSPLLHTHTCTCERGGGTARRVRPPGNATSWRRLSFFFPRLLLHFGSQPQRNEDISGERESACSRQWQRSIAGERKERRRWRRRGGGKREHTHAYIHTHTHTYTLHIYTPKLLQ